MPPSRKDRVCRDVSGMLACRRCGDDTQVVVEVPNSPVRDRTQTLRRIRECVSCNARAGTTERWSDDDSAEFYRARYELAAEWIGKLAFLLKTPAATSKMGRNGSGRTWTGTPPVRDPGESEAAGISSPQARKEREGPEVPDKPPDPAVGRSDNRVGPTGAETVLKLTGRTVRAKTSTKRPTTARTTPASYSTH